MAAFPDRVIDGKFFFIAQKFIKPADAHQMAVDRLGCQLFSQQVVDVVAYFLMRYLFDWLVYPYNELFEVVQIASKGVR